MDDEGLHWETNDEKILVERFNHYNYLLNVVGEALTNIPHKAGESVDSLAGRIEEILKKKFGDK